MILNLITIFMVSVMALFFIRLYSARSNEDPSITPSEVFMDLLSDATVESTTRALEKPKYGDIGDFTGYDDSSISKGSGLGGTVQVYGPTKMSDIRSGNYVSLEQPSIKGLM